MSKVATLRWLASRKGPITDRQLMQVEKWLDADWESHDLDPDVRRLLYRFVKSCKGAYPRNMPKV